MISTKGRYAIRVMIDLAENDQGHYIPLKDIAARQEISKKYLEIICKEMVAGGLITGSSGKGGGYRLCRKPEEYTLDEILELGWKEYAADEERLKNYGAPFEKALLNRIEKYRENYFLWVRDFSIPTTNNLSERGLRGIKTKMKVSGQFESVENAQDHAVNRTYLETCRRNGINEMEALRRAAEGNPFTVDEIFGNH